MGRLILGRLGGALGVWLAVAALTFAMVHLVPGDPARALAGPQADPATLLRIRKELGLDDPILSQFGRYLWGILQGDWGVSFVTKRPVLASIWERFPATAALAFAALGVYLVVGGGLGVMAALRRGSWIDRLASGFAILGYALPTFWIGTLLLVALAFWVPIFPLYGSGTVGHLVLPAITLGIAGAATYARVIRQQLSEELSKDYVRAARAKGLDERTVVGRHALGNAVVPIVTLLGLDLAGLLGGAVVTESVFGWPGVGLQAVAAINDLDLPMIMGTVLFSASLIVVVNLVVDLAYHALDPRMRA